MHRNRLQGAANHLGGYRNSREGDALANQWARRQWRLCWKVAVAVVVVVRQLRCLLPQTPRLCWRTHPFHARRQTSHLLTPPSGSFFQSQ